MPRHDNPLVPGDPLYLEPSNVKDCGSEQPEDDETEGVYSGFICTVEHGYSGDHAAHGPADLGNEQYARWPNKGP